MGLIVGIGILVAIFCGEGLLLAVLLMHVAGLDEFDVTFGSVFKLGLAGGLSGFIATLAGIPFAIFLPGPIAILCGFAGAAIVLGYFLAQAYGTELKRTSIAMAIYIAVNVVASLMLGSVGVG
ncbi:MAG: hypothetical protein ABGX16_26410 [Pirellulales bacterium]